MIIVKMVLVIILRNAPILCELEIKARKAKLLGNKGLAKGDMCDFWIVGDKVPNPK